MKQESLSNRLINTKFGIEFTKVLAPLTGKHLKIYLKNKVTLYDDIGDDKEKKLKEIGHYYGHLQTAISDLELVLAFLRFDNRKLILELFPNLDTQEQYYKYHLENFIIRITTITEIVGKLGNSIYETGLPEEKCNGYKFKEEIKKTDPKCSAILEKLLINTKEIKDKRHRKLHSGDTGIGYFEGIVFWDELSKIINTDANPILDELTDNNIEEEIERLQKELNHIIDLVVEFTDYATGKFIEIVNR